jgi:hypothetical protein
VAKLVMVVEVFAAERDRENTLPDERAHAMFDEMYKFLLDLTDGVGWPFEVMARLIARPR